MDNLGKVYPVLSTAHRAERATLRAARELARLSREHNPEAALGDESLALTPAGLARLIGCHRANYPRLEWRDLAEMEPVPVPVRNHERERAARHALATWKSNWYDRLFANEAARRRVLNEKVMEAAREDETAFKNDHRVATAHNAQVLGARKLIELDPHAIKQVVAAKTKLAEIKEPMNGFGVALPGRGRVIAVVEAIQEGDVPYVRLAEGRRQEDIPPSERKRIHLAAACSVGLRVGADLAAVLPVGAVEVVVTSEPAGVERGEPRAILQMLIPAAALMELPWTRTDALNLARSLRARLDWSPENGFSPIELAELVPPPPLAV